ncbi:hypothetical protein [Methylocystis rosea]|uniref:DUF4760 domain-containing protein n=1 Tax=Methylocystis rosea TaxID=173366 RepID=A0A3G8M3N2_9HYPH|nr:hypothetical protein [Methylocystis rosea]AZG76317.1 hypothetical protein EHO51_06005 [Methylocystis rosea]
MSVATDLASATGQCIQAAAAVIGLGAIWWQIRESRKTSDVQSLQAFLRDAKEHENALLRATTEDEQHQAFIEFLNFLEAYSAAINGGLFPRVTSDIVREKIVEAVAMITEAEAWHGKLAAAITSKTTFKCLKIFMRREKPAISAAIRARAALSK